MKNLNKYKLVEIINIENIQFEKPISVYDLSVKNNESYLANNNFVHNCTTSANVAIHYPMGSLIQECRKIKIAGGYWNCNIVADGGMKGYADVIKALGLGADFVMIGSLFNKSIESSGFNYFHGIKVPQNLAKYLWKKGYNIRKKYRGMSTKSVQKSWGKDKLTTAEGVTRFRNVEYTLCQWTNNFKDYLKSAMSYSDAKNLESFIGYAEFVHITSNALTRYQK